MIGLVELEALMSILWTVFHDSRRSIGIACTKADFLDLRGMRPKIRSTDGLIRNMESGIMKMRDDFRWDFQKEHLHRSRAAHKDTSSTQPSSVGGVKRQSNNPNQGDNKRTKVKIAHHMH